jgi:predicted dinucleotide-binding enzyme
MCNFDKGIQRFKTNLLALECLNLPQAHPSGCCDQIQAIVDLLAVPKAFEAGLAEHLLDLKANKAVRLILVALDSPQAPDKVREVTVQTLI